MTELPPPPGSAALEAEHWCRVELYGRQPVEPLRTLASMDRTFVMERPGELRGLVEAFAERLADFARRN
ncbi:hypothetical protein ACIQZO_09325 [Streptomyces sp. NPDC097617]|uniref:hypothetical protein n=1 Tax=Streptomyces sp. NPDC097617 TaxID=3366091 RepID=UPI003805EC5C